MVKNLSASAGAVRDTGSIPVLGRSPGRGNGSPLQYSCLENPINRGVWWAIFHRVTKVGHNWRDSAHIINMHSKNLCSLYSDHQLTILSFILIQSGFSIFFFFCWISFNYEHLYCIHYDQLLAIISLSLHFYVIPSSGVSCAYSIPVCSVQFYAWFILGSVNVIKYFIPLFPFLEFSLFFYAGLFFLAILVSFLCNQGQST